MTFSQILNRKQLITIVILSILTIVNIVYWEKAFDDMDKGFVHNFTGFVALLGVMFPISLLIEVISRKFKGYQGVVSFLLYLSIPLILSYIYSFRLLGVLLFMTYWFFDEWFRWVQVRFLRTPKKGINLFTILSLCILVTCYLELFRVGYIWRLFYAFGAS